MNGPFDQLRAGIEGRLIARAGQDAEFEALLRRDPARAIEVEMGIRFPAKLSAQLIQDHGDTLFVSVPRTPTLGPGPVSAMTGIPIHPKPLEASTQDVQEAAAVTGQLKAPQARDPAWYAPVFVVCTARSCSSVTTAMIGRHPQLFAFPELGLFRDVTVDGLFQDPPAWRGVPAERRCAGLLRALAQVHEGEQTEDSVVRAREWLTARLCWPVPHVYDHLLSLVAPGVGVEKTPENSSRVDSIARLLRAYPRARFIHLVRHPIATARSMYMAWKCRGYWDVPDWLMPSFCLGAWYYHNERLKDLVCSLPPDRAYGLRAEDVLENPKETLVNLCLWLGVQTGADEIDRMLEPELWTFAGLGPSGAVGGGDPGFLRDSKKRSYDFSREATPKDWLVDPALLVSVAELAGHFGYDSL